jgi:hypothetical protein
LSKRTVSNSLQSKLARIRAGAYTPADFIIADAKDADMAFAIPGMGPRPDGSSRSRAEFLQSIRDICATGIIDIMLTSAANGELLAAEGLFARSPATLAIRGNDTTDIWRVRGANYHETPSRPFRSANLKQTSKFCGLTLYSMTFNNDLDADFVSLSEFARYRQDCLEAGTGYFLEVFNPNAPQNLDANAIPAYVNDMIVRALAGLTKAERPQFLKIAYNGAKAMDELVSFDPSLVVGILGGSSGTTRDCFELLHQAERNGARVALFGRKINLAESPLDLVSFFRPVIEGAIKPKEAVRAYHTILAGKGIEPKLALSKDLMITEAALEGHGSDA